MSSAVRRTLIALGGSLALATGAMAGLDDAGASLLGGSAHEGTVKARLIADHTAIAPGETFTVGIELTMASGWHTYWENGGDAGLPTTVDWTLPEGWTAGDIQWPVPHRYEEEGDLVTFGYADRTVLLVDFAVPETAAPGETAQIAAAIEWLQCKDICIPGGTETSIGMPVRIEAEASPAIVLAKFAAARAELPSSAGSLMNVGLHPFQSLDMFPVEGTGEVAVVLAGLTGFTTEHAEFFPQPSDELWLRDAEFRTDGENLAVVIAVEVDSAVEPGSVAMLSAVIRVPRTDGEPDWRIQFEVPVSIADEGSIPLPSSAAIFADPTAPFLEAGTDATAAATTGLGLFRYLLLAFAGGVILNVMPCVLPVISLKILGFVSQADEDPRKITRLGFVFAAGVVASFLVLAGAVIALQAAGEHIGWGFQFQNPAFVAALAVVVFTFSLSLLGVFEVGGVAVLAGLGAAAADRKEYADAFFHGVLTTILATPCTAPMLGPAIAFALLQPPAVILIIFLSVALGLASPYVLLSMNPRWLKYVPKPGEWMDTFKQGMGFLMLATLVWLLFVFGAQTGSDGLTWLLAFLLLVGFFAWVHGRFLNLMSSRMRGYVIWTVTIVCVGFGYKQMLHETLFPPAGARELTDASIGPRAEVTAGGIVWEPFSVQYLDDAVHSGRTVFIDFTADWCWTCKVNEKTVLANAEVEDAFRENDVLTLKGDWTRKNPEITEILKRHSRAGVPFYAVYPAGRPSEVIVLPEIINKQLVLESLRKAGPSESGV